MAVEGLKIRRASALGGSIPPPGTSKMNLRQPARLLLFAIFTSAAPSNPGRWHTVLFCVIACSVKCYGKGDASGTAGHTSKG